MLPLPESTTAYAAAKAALTTYSKSLSREVTPKGVRVLSVAPGWIETEASRNLQSGSRQKREPIMKVARGWSWTGSAGSRWDGPRHREVADLIVFLASPRSASIAGTEYRIDGGTISTLSQQASSCSHRQKESLAHAGLLFSGRLRSCASQH